MSSNPSRASTLIAGDVLSASGVVEGLSARAIVGGGYGTPVHEIWSAYLGWQPPGHVSLIGDAAEELDHAGAPECPISSGVSNGQAHRFGEWAGCQEA